MTVSDIPIAGNDRKNSRTVNFDEFNRTLIAVAQMAGDALILVTLSYASLNFVIFIQHHETKYRISLIHHFDSRHRYHHDFLFRTFWSI
jgi:hypothetical protein